MTFAGKKVLLVEDAEDNRGLIRALMEDFFEEAMLLETGDGESGVALAREYHPDLVLMDLSLPVLDGWEATRRLKADPATAAIPVVALTAHAMEGDEARAREAGCDGYVTKPISVIGMQDVIESYIGEARA